MAGRIFISYRREDAAGSAALLYEHLSRAFGESQVFMDVDNLMAGQRFDQQLEKALAECEVLIAVIGPRWLDLLKAKRAARERDYVREEITAALGRGVVVIPVTVERGTLPQQKELPQDIYALVFHQSQAISQEQRRRDIDWLWWNANAWMSCGSSFCCGSIPRSTITGITTTRRVSAAAISSRT